jgi:hypothetical protein
VRTSILFLALLCVVAQARGALISESVGQGANTSTIVVDFGTNSYAFQVHYDTSLTGLSALQLLDQESSFRLETVHFSFGDLVSGLEYDGHYQSGTGSNGTDWWRYWVSTDGAVWHSSGTGAGGRTLSDGSWDGWTWVRDQGSSPPDVPVPEPLGGACLLVGASFVLTRRR